MWIDVHTHVLPGVDDGAETEGEAFEIIKLLESLGVNMVFFTPHLNHPVVKTDKKKIIETYETFYERVKKAFNKMSFFLGCELYLTPNYPEPISLGETDFVLVEFPVLDFPRYIESVLFDLQLSGFDVMVAHVERYKWLSEQSQLIRKLKDRSVFFQVNVSSILENDKEALWYIKNDLVEFVGSDIHSPYDYNPHIPEDIAKIIEKISSISKSLILQ